MRGIAGLISWDDRPVDGAGVDRLIRSMAICPVDRIQHDREGSARLAHFLKVFHAEDRFEAQPLRSADGNLMLVTDAMLDNRAELAGALGWQSADAGRKPDSAFVLAAYERWREGCSSHLEGKFALAVWNRRERRLFCAVDHLGHRPLYYWRGRSELAFATTLRGLFALPGISRDLDEDSLAAHVARIAPEDPSATLYRAVRRLPGGHQMTIDAQDARVVRHWNPDPGRVLHLRSDADYLEAFQFELERAVRTSLQRSPRNVGVMVSGGLDSASVTVLAGGILAEQGRRLQAFHLVPDENRTAGPLLELDESRFVRALERHAPHIDFHFLPNRPTPLLPDEWEERFEDDFVPFHRISRNGDTPLARLLGQLEVDLLLDGAGGNFLVSLECRPADYLAHLFAAGHWSAWLRECRGCGRAYGQSMAGLVRRSALGPLKRRLLPSGAPPPDSPVFLLQPGFRDRTGIERRLLAQKASWQTPSRDFRRRLCRVLTEVAVQQTGAAPAVVHRNRPARFGASPMLDRRLNEFCLSLPFDQQIRNGIDRRLVRESMRGRLPEEVRLRVTRGFPQPAFRHLFGQSEIALRRELDRLSSSGPASRYLDFPRLRSWVGGGKTPSEKYGLALIEGAMVGRFLEWNARTSPPC